MLLNKRESKAYAVERKNYEHSYIFVRSYYSSIGYADSPPMNERSADNTRRPLRRQKKRPLVFSHGSRAKSSTIPSHSISRTSHLRVSPRNSAPISHSRGWRRSRRQGITRSLLGDGQGVYCSYAYLFKKFFSF